MAVDQPARAPRTKASVYVYIVTSHLCLTKIQHIRRCLPRNPFGPGVSFLSRAAGSFGTRWLRGLLGAGVPSLPGGDVQPHDF